MPSDPDGLAPETAYAAAFRAAGIDADALEVAEAGARIKKDADQHRPGDGDRPRRLGGPAPGETTRPSRGAAAGRGGERRRPRPQAGAAAARRSDRPTARSGSRPSESWRKLATVDALPAASLGLLGAGLADAGDREAAVDLLRRGQLRHPGEVRLHHELARVLDALARPEEAIRHYTAARAIRPETAHELAHALVCRGETGAAIDVFRDLVRRRPTNGVHAVCLGALLLVQGRSREAVEILDAAIATSRQAIKVRPDDAGAYQALGLTLWHRGNREEAVAAFRETIRLMPDETAARIYIGRIMDVLGRYDEALGVLSEAVRLRPDDAEAHTRLGNALAATGRVDEAADAFRAALRLGSDSWEIHEGLGILFLRRGRWQEGADEYELARVNSSRSGDDGLLFFPGHRMGIDDIGVWYFSAVAQLRAGRIDHYRDLCREMLRRFGGRFGGGAELVARVCLMSPDDPRVVAEAARLAERALKAQPSGPVPSLHRGPGRLPVRPL